MSALFLSAFILPTRGFLSPSGDRCLCIFGAPIMKNQDILLYVKKPNGRYALAEPEKVIQSANEIVDAHYRCNDSTVISNPNVAREQLYLRGHWEHETFIAMFLDSKHRVLRVDEMFRGTIDSASVPVREVVKDALKYNAAAMIVSHNHPSGIQNPSTADKHLTESLYTALNLVGVKLLDHFIFGEGGHEAAYSFAEFGGL